MRCPKCGYENKGDAVACLMCYAMLKAPTGGIKAKPEKKPKVKPEPEPVKPIVPPVVESTVPPPTATEKIVPVQPQTPAEEPFIETKEETPKLLKPKQPVLEKPERSGFIATWWQVISSPSEFFGRMDMTGGLSKPYVFALINALIFGAGGFVGITSGWYSIFYTPTIPLIFSLINLFFVLALWGLIFSNLIFLLAGILNIGTKLLMGKGSYRDTFKVVAYAGSILVFIWIPVINILALFRGLYIMVIGLKKVHSFSTGKAVLTLMLPGMLGIAVFGVMLTMMMFR